MKFYVLGQDGADYSIRTEPDYSGSCEEHETFAKAKRDAIFKIKNDIDELKMTLEEIRKLRRRDVVGGEK